MIFIFSLTFLVQPTTQHGHRKIPSAAGSRPCIRISTTVVLSGVKSSQKKFRFSPLCQHVCAWSCLSVGCNTLVRGLMLLHSCLMQSTHVWLAMARRSHTSLSTQSHDFPSIRFPYLLFQRWHDFSLDYFPFLDFLSFLEFSFLYFLGQLLDNQET